MSECVREVKPVSESLRETSQRVSERETMSERDNDE